LKVAIAIARLKNRARSNVDYMLLDNLQTHLDMRINDSLMGSKMKTLTERKKTLRIEEELQKKRGLLG